MFEFYLIIFWIQAFLAEHWSIVVLISLAPIFTGLLVNGVATLTGGPMPTEFLRPSEIWSETRGWWSKFNWLGKLIFGPLGTWFHWGFLLGAAPVALIGHPFKVFKFLFLKRG